MRMVGRMKMRIGRTFAAAAVIVGLGSLSTIALGVGVNPPIGKGGNAIDRLGGPDGETPQPADACTG